MPLFLVAGLVGLGGGFLVSDGVGKLSKLVVYGGIGYAGYKAYQHYTETSK